jgi:UDP-3-O-[3-hydroxymyristoyl] N-acetylglucosamine deacetylase|tara:strand:+ start:819 stop:1745 length:927 start_codon:yes stop_codon:yes gene_type:complete
MHVNSQKTIKEQVELDGIGLHNGIKVNLRLKPAEANSGIKFKRTDINNDENIIEASYKNVSSSALCTKIKNSYGVSVSTIEHLMATFYGEGIDNVLVEIDAPEVPIMDGSAFDFVTAIRSYGIQEQNCSKKFIKVLKKIEVKDGSKYISIEPLTNDLIIDFEIIYKNPLIRTRRKEFKLSNGDLVSIYNSKTFCLYEDIDQIKNQGLAKGGSLENAIVVKENKILNEDGLRYRDEFVNHKILDCLGDLMLSGHRIFGHIKTSQGGHQLTNVLLKEFLSNKLNWEFVSFEGKQKNSKDKTYISPIAVNA